METPDGPQEFLPEEGVPQGAPETDPDQLQARVGLEGRPKKKKKKKKSEIGTTRGIETMFRASYRVHMDLTALADSKANIMISINGLIMSIILASIAPKIDSNLWLIIPTISFLLSCLVAIIFAVLAARPRINSTEITLDDVLSNRANVLFFGNYKFLTREEFEIGVVDLLQNSDKLYYNMIRDLYGIGSVLSKKFKLLRNSYLAFMIGITISVILFILVFAIQGFNA